MLLCSLTTGFLAFWTQCFHQTCRDKNTLGVGGSRLGWGGVYGFQLNHLFPHPMNLVALKILKITTKITSRCFPILYLSINSWMFGGLVCLFGLLSAFCTIYLYALYATSQALYVKLYNNWNILILIFRCAINGKGWARQGIAVRCKLLYLLLRYMVVAMIWYIRFYFGFVTFIYWIACRTVLSSWTWVG